MHAFILRMILNLDFCKMVPLTDGRIKVQDFKPKIYKTMVTLKYE